MAKLIRIRLLVSFCLWVTCLTVGGCQYLNFLAYEELHQQVPRKSVKSKSFRIPPYVFIADFELDRGLPIFRELSSLRDRVYRELKLTPSDKTIKVYLFKSKSTYQTYIQQKYPYLPDRRAFFVAEPTVLGDGEELKVFTYWGENIQQDLRHELTHALLHSVLKDVPLWLDEGLAEYFEVPQGWSGVNYTHLTHLKGEGKTFRPQMARLEKMTEVHQMNLAEYREAWAWVHWMLRGNGQAKSVLINYLHELKKTESPGVLEPRLRLVTPQMESDLVYHIGLLKLPAKNLPSGDSPSTSFGRK